MMNRKSKKRRVYLCWLAAAVLAVVFTAPAFAQEDPNDPVLPDPNMPEEPRLPGTVEGTGTYFEVTDSNYLNITFESSEPVHLRLESVPEMIVMDINTAEGATSTQITLTGFPPSTTFYKYEDDYHNEVIFTTDINGTYTFVQDLTQPHLVFIQPNSGTWFLAPSAGQIPPIGAWNESTRTFTLTEDVYETIQIDEDDLTLDGAGHTVIGPHVFFGVYLPGRTGVTIKNVNVEQSSYAIYIYNSSNNTLTGNRASNNYCGIWLDYSSSNTLTANTASNNRGYGIYLSYSSNNSLTDNRANSNSNGTYGYGIYLYYSSNNTLTGNTVESNKDFGIFLARSGGSTLSANTMSGNSYNFYVYGWSAFHFDNDIDTSNTVDSKPIYYVKNATGVVYDSSTNAGVFYAIYCDDITIKDLTLTKNWFGVFLWKTHNSTIENVTASNNSCGICLYYSSSNTLTANATSNNVGTGIHLLYSSNNSLTGNTASDNQYGIYPAYSSDNALTNNTANRNSEYGIYLVYYCDRNTLTGNVANSNNYRGICLSYSSGNTLTGNTATDNAYGIYLSTSGGSTLRSNTMSGNHYNFGVSGSADSDFNNDIDTSNTVDGKPVYYIKNGVGAIYDNSTNAGVFYAINCDGITIKDLTLTKNSWGVCLWKTHNSNIENVTASNNYYGISLRYSNGNTLTGNTANWNNRFGISLSYSTDVSLTGNTANSNGYNSYGIYLGRSSYVTLIDNITSNNWFGIGLSNSSSNILTGNTASNNRYGIRLSSSNDNQIYNNNFIDNTVQAYVYSGSRNVFNLEKPIGGNYWSDWTDPDNDNDWFVDYPYVFDYGNQDNLPWTLEDGWLLNHPPVANAGGPYVEQATSWNGAYVDLDGTASSDPEGIPLAYEWDMDLSWDSDGDSDPTNDVDETSPTSTWSFPIGQTEISLVVTDDQGLKSEPDVTSVTVSVIDVSIDIKPGSFPNSINMGSTGVVPVAFLTDPDFDASTIDPATVTLRGEDFTDGLVKLRGKKDAPVPMSNLDDIDGDGDLDLIVHLVTEKLAEYELEAMCELGALTYNGYVVSGSDVIHVIPE